METIYGLIGGLLAGITAGYFVVRAIFQKANTQKIEEANRKSDLENSGSTPDSQADRG